MAAIVVAALVIDLRLLLLLSPLAGFSFITLMLRCPKCNAAIIGWISPVPSKRCPNCGIDLTHPYVGRKKGIVGTPVSSAEPTVAQAGYWTAQTQRRKVTLLIGAAAIVGGGANVLVGRALGLSSSPVLASVSILFGLLCLVWVRVARKE
jgi:hypothetical protein